MFLESATAIIEAVRHHEAARLNAIPGVWQRVLDHLRETPQPPLATLRFADEEATAEAFDGEWFRTGNGLGQIIRTGGESVSPSQVEQAFVGVAGIADVAVIGVPDPQWGEVVTLCVVPDGSRPTPAPVGSNSSMRFPALRRPNRSTDVDSSHR